VELGAAGVGDVHLWALLRVHGSVSGGGTTFAKEVLTPAQFAAAAAACDYFGLTAFSDLIRRIAVMESDDELEMNDEYYALDLRGQAMTDAFERRYATSPGDFDPPDT
jgi:hypothetical protein